MTPNQITYRPRSYLSVSTLIDYARCPRRYWYHKCGLDTPGTKLAPTYGTAMHHAVPQALITGDIIDALEAFMKIWEPVETQQMLDGDKDDKKRTRRHAERSLKHFIHTHTEGRATYSLLPFPVETFTLDDQTSKYEVPWVIDIGLRVPLVGRFDGYCEQNHTKDKYIWELKTAGRIGPGFFDCHDLHIQNLCYALVAQTLLGESIKGVLVEAMLVDGKKTENIAHPMPVQSHQIEDALLWLQDTGQRLLDDEQRYLERLESNAHKPERAFIKNYPGCSPYPWFYMAMFPCEFMDLCKLDNWHPLTSLYDIRPEHDFMELSIGQTDAVEVTSD